MKSLPSRASPTTLSEVQVLTDSNAVAGERIDNAYAGCRCSMQGDTLLSQVS